MTECHRINAESDRKADMLLSSQLLDYDEGPTEDRPGQTPNNTVVFLRDVKTNGCHRCTCKLHFGSGTSTL